LIGPYLIAMKRRRNWRAVAHAVAALAVLVLAACDAPPVESPNLLGAAVAPPLWPSDGVLDDPGLQEIVDLQVEGAVTDLVGALYGTVPANQARAAFAMASVREMFASQAVVDQLSHADPLVRAAAAFALGQIPRPRSTSRISATLATETDSLARFRMVEALGKSVEESVGLTLVESPPDVPEAVLVLALARLSMLHPPDSLVLARLSSALTSRDGETREYGAWYFGRSADAVAWEGRVADVRAALDGYALADPAAAGLLRALARVGDPSDLPRILRFALSPDWRLRVRTATALAGFVSEDSARETLFGALDDPSTHVTVAAATSIGEIRRLLAEDRDRAEAWIDGHPDDWRTAVPILGALAAQGRSGFVRAWLEDRSGAPLRVRAHGVRALARTPDQGATRSLMEIARGDTLELAPAALQGLVNRWPRDRGNRELHRAYWDVFSEALQGGDRAVVSIVAPVLNDSVFLGLGAVRTLMETYRGLAPMEDIEAQQAILTTLGQMGDTAAVPLLQEAMADPHLAVRRLAGETVQLIVGRRAVWSREPTVAARRADWDALRALGRHPRLILETGKGSVVIRLATDLAPITVQTISEFAQEGLYDGVPFHRVVPDFVVQGGDFERFDGYGGPGFTIRSEITGIPYRRGVVGMASAGPDTEGSQFFITHSIQPHLEADYTAFGWVEEGMDVVDVLYEGDEIVRARVEPDPGDDVGDPAGS